MNKEELRKEMKNLRKNMSKEEIFAKSDLICNKLFTLDVIKNAKTVMVYISAFNEVRTQKIIQKLIDDKKRVSAPITNEENKSMSAYYFDDLSKLVKGAYGILEPPMEHMCDISKIDVVVVPGIAFDKNGNRMGFGEGYYDRFLADFKGTKIGIGYKFQCKNNIDVNEYDIAMDYVINEEDIYVI